VLHFAMQERPFTRAFKPREVMQGQADDLVGGVFMKRLNKNMHVLFVLAKGGRHCWPHDGLRVGGRAE